MELLLVSRGGKGVGIFHFLLFALVFFVGFIIYAFIDHKRLQSKAKVYLGKKLGLYGVPFEMTRYVRMARVIREEDSTFLGVFPIHDRHIFLKDFVPNRIFHIPPDGVILGDDSRNRSYVFLDRKGKLHYGEVEEFLPQEGGYIRRGAKSVVLGVDDFPGTMKDWFVVDRHNRKTLFPRHDDGSDSLQSSFFYFLEDFVPDVGDIVNDKGTVILVDQKEGSLALRMKFGEDFWIHKAKDIEDVSLVEGEGKKMVLTLVLKGAKDALNLFFDHKDEAFAWVEKIRELKEGAFEGGKPRRVFVRLRPVYVSSV